jgi:hypothetical protein
VVELSSGQTPWSTPAARSGLAAAGGFAQRRQVGAQGDDLGQGRAAPGLCSGRRRTGGGEVGERARAAAQGAAALLWGGRRAPDQGAAAACRPQPLAGHGSRMGPARPGGWAGAGGPRRTGSGLQARPS